MKTGSDEYKTTGMEMVVKYLAVIMALAYVVIGALLIARSGSMVNITGKYTVPLGVILIGYGIFRCYKTYQRYFQK